MHPRRYKKRGLLSIPPNGAQAHKKRKPKHWPCKLPGLTSGKIISCRRLMSCARRAPMRQQQQKNECNMVNCANSMAQRRPTG
eukprot:2302257-Karenia_brevis.AAC.1